MDYIKAALGKTSTSTFDSSVEENKNLLLKLQQKRHFGQVGHASIEELKVQGPPLIENLKSLLLDTDRLREAVSNH